MILNKNAFGAGALCRIHDCYLRHCLPFHRQAVSGDSFAVCNTDRMHRLFAGVYCGEKEINSLSGGHIYSPYWIYISTVLYIYAQHGEYICPPHKGQSAPRIPFIVFPNTGCRMSGAISASGFITKSRSAINGWGRVSSAPEGEVTDSTKSS